MTNNDLRDDAATLSSYLVWLQADRGPRLSLRVASSRHLLLRVRRDYRVLCGRRGPLPAHGRRGHCGVPGAGQLRVYDDPRLGFLLDEQLFRKEDEVEAVLRAEESNYDIPGGEDLGVHDPRSLHTGRVPVTGHRPHR